MIGKERFFVTYTFLSAVMALFFIALSVFLIMVISFQAILEQSGLETLPNFNRLELLALLILSGACTFLYLLAPMFHKHSIDWYYGLFSLGLAVFIPPFTLVAIPLLLHWKRYKVKAMFDALDK
ncbi:MAG: hypothetical protein HRT89_21730 [Lentisphaeria bacterium]|nr:hypothetical protein [Lentisphaeria bacterium]NQZ70683.1 hypothetical protein [Lentisphaeria bacterium]